MDFRGKLQCDGYSAYGAFAGRREGIELGACLAHVRREIYEAKGKKNWLFFGDAGAGQRSAILYTIIENCRLHGIDPYAYLCDVLTRLPGMTNHQIASVTPKAWAHARKANTPLAAAA